MVFFQLDFAGGGPVHMTSGTAALVSLRVALSLQILIVYKTRLWESTWARDEDTVPRSSPTAPTLCRTSSLALVSLPESPFEG